MFIQYKWKWKIDWFSHLIGRYNRVDIQNNRSAGKVKQSKSQDIIVVDFPEQTFQCELEEIEFATWTRVDIVNLMARHAITNLYIIYSLDGFNAVMFIFLDSKTTYQHFDFFWLSRWFHKTCLLNFLDASSHIFRTLLKQEVRRSSIW
jgi:hypothetical protein